MVRINMNKSNRNYKNIRRFRTFLSAYDNFIQIKYNLDTFLIIIINSSFFTER